jgi:hypothetical protein
MTSFVALERGDREELHAGRAILVNIVVVEKVQFHRHVQMPANAVEGVEDREIKYPLIAEAPARAPADGSADTGPAHQQHRATDRGYARQTHHAFQQVQLPRSRQQNGRCTSVVGIAFLQIYRRQCSQIQFRMFSLGHLYYSTSNELVLMCRKLLEPSCDAWRRFSALL